MTKTNPIFRILAIVLILASLGMVALPWISLSNYGNSEYETYYQIGKDFLDLISSHQTIDDGVLAPLFGVAAILIVITAILGFILAALRVRWGGVPYFVASLLNLGYFMYLMTYINDQARMNLAHLEIGAILCPAFALIAMILLFIPDNTARPVSAGAYGGGYAPAPRAATWTCPGCGTILADRERFCPNCGKARAVTAPAAPAVQRCAACGSTLEKGASFCPNCGSPVGGARPAAPTYTAPGTPSFTAPSAPQPRNPAPGGAFHSAGDDDL